MEISEIKMRILRILWQFNRPAYLREISGELNLKTRSVNMHLLGLRRKGYVEALGNGLYALTDLGKELLGFPRIDENLARRILSKVPFESAFHFYFGENSPLNISSDNLIDLCDKIREIDIRSLEFHLFRGDFENWISFLGDIELAKRLELIRKSNLSGGNLREKVYECIKVRCDELLKISEIKNDI
ncbi:MAG: DUF5752 family protein [Candidatus Bathyarchaeota archaeon]|nr:DUF5752 family protein [Candidatus Bathyarchaeota archaeon]